MTEEELQTVVEIPDTPSETDRSTSEEHDDERNLLLCYLDIRSILKQFDKGVKINKLKERYKILNDFSAQDKDKYVVKSKLFKYLAEKYALVFHDDELRRKLFEKMKSANCLLHFVSEAIQLEKERLDRINTVRNSNTILHVLLKHEDLSEEVIVNCARQLVEAGLNVNKCDFEGMTVKDHISRLLLKFKDLPLKTNNLEAIDKIIVDSERLYNPEGITEQCDPCIVRTHIFNLIIKEKYKEFRSFPGVKYYVDDDDGESTIMQVICKKPKNGQDLETVKFILKHAKDPNRSTPANGVKPLELAAQNNSHELFTLLLKCKATKVTEEDFKNFVKQCGPGMKHKYFKEFLHSEKVDVDFRSSNMKNPLHYAIIFNQTRAIKQLLSRGSQLLERDNSGKSSLDIIECEDLESYFDSCLIPDTYRDITSPKYKMLLKFTALITGHSRKKKKKLKKRRQQPSGNQDAKEDLVNEDGVGCYQCLKDQKRGADEREELQIIHEIGENPDLERLLKHPLIYSFITLKWMRAKKYFWLILFLQTIVYLLLTTVFLNFEYITRKCPALCEFLVLLNLAKVVLVFGNSASYDQVTFHWFTEVTSSVTMLATLFLNWTSSVTYQRKIRAFIFVQTSIWFLLTLGYHPKLSKYSTMLKEISKSFCMFALFFSIPIIGFALGFYVLFQNSEAEESITSLPQWVFKTYIMITGEFNSDDVPFTDGFDRFYFILFVIFIAIILMNFWTGVAVSDINEIEKHTEISSIKNIVVFLKFVDAVYRKRLLRKALSQFPGHPFLYKQMVKKSPACKVDFYVNRKAQFGLENFPKRLDSTSLAKIRHFVRSKKSGARTSDSEK